MSEVIMFVLGAVCGWGLHLAMTRQRATVVPIHEDPKPQSKVPSRQAPIGR